MNGQTNGSSGTSSPLLIYDARSVAFPGPTLQSEDYESIRATNPAIVIDNGSSQLRAGWATEPSPRIAIENLVARYKERRAPKTYCLVGNDVLGDQAARLAAKSPYEGPIISNWDLMETVLDYTFVKLGLQSDSLKHSLIMTEPVCNPNYNRKTMSELLFETYSAPSVSYGIDALFSYRQNVNTSSSSGLVISLGNHATHVIPVIQGRGVLSQAKRLQWGGTQAVEFMLKLLQLKYPNFPTKLTLLQAQSLLWDHCYVAQDYAAELGCMLDKTHLKNADRTIQFPYTEYLANAKSAEELEREKERKKESGRRLQEQAARMRAEKLVQNENDLEYYRNIQQLAESEGKREFQRRVESEGFGDVSELEKEIKRLEAAIKRSKQKDMASAVSQLDEEDIAPPSYPLLDIPDDQLDAEGLKQKRQQRLNKAGYDARMRTKAEKEAERRRQEELQLADDEQRMNNFDEWLEGKRQSRNELMERLKVQRRLKAELNDRKSLASQMRMKSIANLASDIPNGKKRRKNDDDMFGANDADWNIYKDIGTSKEGAEVESEDDEERTIEALRRLEGILLLHDAAFDESQLVDAEKDPSKSLIHAFLRGASGPFDHNDPAQVHQIHLNVERIRVPEVLFSPGIAGVDQAGLIEISSGIMQRSGHQTDLIKDIFVTGGFGSLEGLDTRIERELRSVLPAGSALRVRKAGDVKLDAWRGAAKWFCEMDRVGRGRNLLTKKVWEECGGEYLIEHEMGNVRRRVVVKCETETSRSSTLSRCSHHLDIMVLAHLWVFSLCIMAVGSANPISISCGDKPGKGPCIPVPQLYRALPIAEIPTTIENDVVLTNITNTRYGYFVGRPVARFFREGVGQYLLNLLSDVLSRMTPLLHWAILISDERPQSVNSELASSGSKVPHPGTGIIFELRNSMQTHLIYLDVKNWSNYVYQQENLIFLGALNYTDQEILNIGKAYIQEIGREGFHNFYRNCQHFTSWYIKALWPKLPPAATRGDQLLGKLLWWFRDWRKTGKWGANKLKAWLGLKTDNIKELDSSTEFVGMEDILNRNSRSEDGN